MSPRYLAYFYVSSVPFTREVLDGTSSLGGSESACLGLCEALARRGHDVHIFAEQLGEGLDGEWRGVQWHSALSLMDTLAFAPPDVFVSLRMPHVFSATIPAKLNVLWNQDLLTDPNILGQLAQVDHLAYVSDYHRHQWEALQPVLAKPDLGWVTRNGIDLADVPAPGTVARHAHRFLYTSRPERGLKPLLQMWPRISQAIPDAELHICRYQSMYDGEGSHVAQTCQSFDALTAQVQAETGGITMLGQLNKPALYRALSGARALLYPGVADFAETNGIAWTEAQACRTPIVASWKGAAPETIHPGAGVLIDGDAATQAYQDAFVAAAVALAHDDLRAARMGQAGRAWTHPRASHDTIAAEWEAAIAGWFEARYAGNRLGVLRSLLWEDNHAAAQIVAEDILNEHNEKSSGEGTTRQDDLDSQEAGDAIALCHRVIRQEELTEENYAKYATQDVLLEVRSNRRLQDAATLVARTTPARLLDVACGNGSMAILLAQRLPEATITGYDSSEGVLALARAAVTDQGLDGRVAFVHGAWNEVESARPFDAVFCGEFLEHTEKPWEVVDELESYATAGGTVTFTVPSGAFGELLPHGTPRLRGHVQSFTLRTLTEMLARKAGLTLQFIPVGISARGSSMGYWLGQFVAHRGGAAVPIDYAHTIVTTRPYQRIAASLIVRDGADWLRRCLASIRPVVDRMVVLDTGSTDGSQAIARAEGAEVVEEAWPGDFGSARNRALALVEADAEWVLWIDADETLDDGHNLRKYATGAGPFRGYVLHQTHLMVDQPVFFDKPVRLFRTGLGIRFYGLVHEQPEDTPDTGIFPALEVPDARILHYGYTTDTVRRQKLLHRNMAYLKQELESVSPRQLATILAMRDLTNLALFARESAGGLLTQEARRYLLQAVALYRPFADPAHRYHELARPFYESALEGLGHGWHVEWAFAAQAGTLRGRPKPERFRVTSVQELRAEVDHKLTTWLQAITTPTFDCEPIVPRDPGAWALADPVLVAQAQG